MSQRKNVGLYNNSDVNPCIKEQEESLACLDANNYKKDKCYFEFLNYRDCKTFWGEVLKKRAKQGVTPYMPTESERKQIIDFLGDNLPYIAL